MKRIVKIDFARHERTRREEETPADDEVNRPPGGLATADYLVILLPPIKVLFMNFTTNSYEMIVHQTGGGGQEEEAHDEWILKFFGPTLISDGSLKNILEVIADALAFMTPKSTGSQVLDEIISPESRRRQIRRRW